MIQFMIKVISIMMKKERPRIDKNKNKNKQV